MDRRFILSLIISFITSLIVISSFNIIVMVVKEKQLEDLKVYSKNLSKQLILYTDIHDLLNETLPSEKKSQVNLLIQNIVTNSPYIEELSFIDSFGKVPLRVANDKPTNAAVSSPNRNILTPHEILKDSKPFLDYVSWEYYLPIQLDDKNDWGVLRVRWKPDASWNYFRFLKQISSYLAAGTFFIMFLLSYFVFLRPYHSEYQRMAKILSLIIGGDYSTRLDSQSFAKGLSEIATYFNRILMDFEEEKKKNLIFDDTLRQVERNCSDYKKSMQEKSDEIIQIKKEMTEGLIRFFEMIWSGVLIIDKNYHIQFMNDQAEKLLRFAKIDDAFIVDESVRQSLNPAFLEETKMVDSVCTWTNADTSRTISCKIRCSRIPTCDESQLYFVILTEEKGYPEKRKFEYYAEFLLVDIFSKSPSDIMEQLHDEYDYTAWIRRITQKIIKLRSLEIKDYGECKTIRLQKWIKDRFESEEPQFKNLLFDTSGLDSDVTIDVPVLLIAELLDTVLRFISIIFNESENQMGGIVEIKTTFDSRGKPIIAVTIPEMRRKDARKLQTILEEKFFMEEPEQESTSEAVMFERDLYYSLYSLIKEILRVYVEFIYTESKNIVTIRMTIRNYSNNLKQEGQRGSERNTSTDALLQSFLTKIP